MQWFKRRRSTCGSNPDTFSIISKGKQDWHHIGKGKNFHMWHVWESLWREHWSELVEQWWNRRHMCEDKCREDDHGVTSVLSPQSMAAVNGRNHCASTSGRREWWRSGRTTTLGSPSTQTGQLESPSCLDLPSFRFLTQEASSATSAIRYSSSRQAIIPSLICRIRS